MPKPDKMSFLRGTRRRNFSFHTSRQNLVNFNLEMGVYMCLVSCVLLSACVSGQNNGSSRPAVPTGTSAAAAVNNSPSLSAAATTASGGASSDDNDYSDADYDDKDVQFDQSPPNVLILLADPENGTTTPLANQPNTEVILDPSLKKIHLFCSAYYPIKWIYTGDGFPFLNVDNTRFTDDFYDPTTYAFSALLELEGLDESQTGNYSCQKWDDDSYLSSYYVFIPGERVLLLEKNSTVAVTPSQSQITLPCSVSNPAANVTLMKLLPPSSGVVAAEWAPVSPSTYKYHPKYGFTFVGAKVNNLLGTYECSVPAVGSKAEISLVIKGSSADKTGKTSSKNRCCDKNYLRSLGDERTSCRGFISQTCQTQEFFDIGKSPCTDWKLTQFLKNRVEPCKDEMDPNGVNSHTGVGYFKTEDTSKPQLFMFCQADPKEYTQGFKMAVQWRNGSMLFVDDERHRIPQFSRFPAGYEVNAEITDLLNPTAPTDILYVHCYIPLKYSFKWIKIVKEIPSEELQVFAPGATSSPLPPRVRPRPTTVPTPVSPIHHEQSDQAGHDHPHDHEHETAEHDEENNESSSSRAVELDNPDINENILSERKGEVEPTVEDIDPTVASTTSASPFSNYRLHTTSANWHVVLSIGLTLMFSLISV